MQTCTVCSSPLPKGRQKYCSQPCSTKALIQSDAYKRGQAKRNAKPRRKIERQCVTCGETWMVDPHTKSRHCSLLCTYPPKKTSSALVHVGEVPFTWLPPQHPVMTRAKPTRGYWRVLVSGPCSWCGAQFTAPTGTGAALYCTRQCSRKAATAKAGRFVVPPSVRLTIYNRDNWTCQLCLEPVDQDLMSTDPYTDWAPSLDHILPQSKGGSHTPDNLRLAHRWCNAIRGDDTYHGEAFFHAA